MTTRLRADVLSPKREVACLERALRVASRAQDLLTMLTQLADLLPDLLPSGVSDRVSLALVSPTGETLRVCRLLPRLTEIPEEWPQVRAQGTAVAAVALRQISLTTFGRRHASNLVVVATSFVLIAILMRGVNLTPLRLSNSWTRAITALTPPALAAIKDLPGPIYLGDGYGLDGSAGLDLLARAEENGIDVRRSPSWAYIYGTKRTIERSQAASEVLFLTESARLLTQSDPYYREIFSFDPLTPDQRAEFDALVAKHANFDHPPGMSAAQIAQGQEQLLEQWVQSELAAKKPSKDFTRYMELLLDGPIVSVFVSNGPPK